MVVVKVVLLMVCVCYALADSYRQKTLGLEVINRGVSATASVLLYLSCTVLTTRGRYSQTIIIILAGGRVGRDEPCEKVMIQLTEKLSICRQHVVGGPMIDLSVTRGLLLKINRTVITIKQEY